jgi:hypothetical protein
MGLFSWDCKGCGHPLISHWYIEKDNRWMMDGVFIELNGKEHRGSYDGYGRLDDTDIVEILDMENPCVYHVACYELLERPGYTGPSNRSWCQGAMTCGKDEHDHNVPEPDTLMALNAIRTDDWDEVQTREEHLEELAEDFFQSRVSSLCKDVVKRACHAGNVTLKWPEEHTIAEPSYGFGSEELSRIAMLFGDPPDKWGDSHLNGIMHWIDGPNAVQTREMVMAVFKEFIRARNERDKLREANESLMATVKIMETALQNAIPKPSDESVQCSSLTPEPEEPKKEPAWKRNRSPGVKKLFGGK